jgi:hypothetical protein
MGTPRRVSAPHKPSTEPTAPVCAWRRIEVEVTNRRSAAFCRDVALKDRNLMFENVSPSSISLRAAFILAKIKPETVQ